MLQNNIFILLFCLISYQISAQKRSSLPIKINLENRISNRLSNEFATFSTPKDLFYLKEVNLPGEKYHLFKFDGRKSTQINFGEKLAKLGPIFISSTNNVLVSVNAGSSIKLFEGRINGSEIQLNGMLPFCSEAFSVMHPTATMTGDTLFFASDMPGGYGGTDIYVVIKKESGLWGTPRNLGNNVNSSDNDGFPFFNVNENLLYFSSKGRNANRDFDIFYINPFDENLPSAHKLSENVNSRADDFGLCFKNKQDFVFSSNRAGTDDIYSGSFIENNSIETIQLHFSPLPKNTVVAFKSDDSWKTILSAHLKDWKISIPKQSEVLFRIQLPSEVEPIFKKIVLSSNHLNRINLIGEEKVISGCVQLGGQQLSNQEVTLYDDCMNQKINAITDVNGCFEVVYHTWCKETMLEIVSENNKHPYLINIEKNATNNNIEFFAEKATLTSKPTVGESFLLPQSWVDNESHLTKYDLGDLLRMHSDLKVELMPYYVENQIPVESCLNEQTFQEVKNFLIVSGVSPSRIDTPCTRFYNAKGLSLNYGLIVKFRK